MSERSEYNKRNPRPKDRDNWMGACLRFNCANRGQMCNQCLRFDMYKESK